jgi:hypothetical protein
MKVKICLLLMILFLCTQGENFPDSSSCITEDPIRDTTSFKDTSTVIEFITSRATVPFEISFDMYNANESISVVKDVYSPPEYLFYTEQKKFGKHFFTRSYYKRDGLKVIVVSFRINKANCSDVDSYIEKYLKN